MSTSLIACLVIFGSSMLLGVPIAFGMIAGSAVYFIMEGIELGALVESMVFGFDDKFVLLAVPLFIFTARLMNTGGITTSIFKFSHKLVGHWRGGLAHVNVLASIIFSGMTGSAVADASGLGLMEVKSMQEAGYRKPFACAVSVASATIGPIIPPSIPMVIYAMLSGASVGSLFLGGVVPGLLMGAGMMAVIAVQSKKRGYPQGERSGAGEIWSAFKQAFLPLLTPAILLGGIYTGVFTPTEAAAVAALYALALVTVVYRNVSIRELIDIMKDVVEGTGFLGLIMAGAFVFSYVIAREQVTVDVAQWLLGLTNSKWTLLLLVNVLFLILGCFLDTMVLMLVVVPIVIPVMEQAGVDMVHFGVVIVLNMMIGLITPPFGMLIFIICGLTKTPMGEVIRELWPYIAVLVGVLLLCTYVPDVVLALPKAFAQ